MLLIRTKVLNVEYFAFKKYSRITWEKCNEGGAPYSYWEGWKKRGVKCLINGMKFKLLKEKLKQPWFILEFCISPRIRLKA